MPYRFRGKANLSDNECDLRDMRNALKSLAREFAKVRVGKPLQTLVDYIDRMERVTIPRQKGRIARFEAEIADKKKVKVHA